MLDGSESESSVPPHGQRRHQITPLDDTLTALTPSPEPQHSPVHLQLALPAAAKSAAGPGHAGTGTRTGARTGFGLVRGRVWMGLLMLVGVVYGMSVLLNEFVLKSGHPLAECVRNTYHYTHQHHPPFQPPLAVPVSGSIRSLNGPNSTNSTNSSRSPPRLVTHITLPPLTPCEPEPTQDTDSHSYILALVGDNGYNNQWDDLLALFGLGVSSGRSVILPPWMNIGHNNAVHLWDSIYNFSYTNSHVPGLRIVSYAYGMAQCKGQLHKYAPVEVRDYNQHNGKCVYSNGKPPAFYIQLEPPNGPPQTQYRNIWFFCPKKDPIMRHVVLVSWLSEIVSGVVSVLNAGSFGSASGSCGSVPVAVPVAVPMTGFGVVSGFGFVGIHLRLGDFAGYCNGHHSENHHLLPNVCPTSREIIIGIVRYCHQLCLLYHNNNQPQATLKRTCTEQQQQQQYKCTVFVATNWAKAINMLYRRLARYREQESLHVDGVRFVMNVTLVTLADVFRVHPWLLSRMMTSRAARRSDGSYLTSMELSVIDQHVLNHATLFIGNVMSTWSRYVYASRIVSGLYNGFYVHHPSLNCSLWRWTPLDMSDMNSVSPTAPFARPRPAEENPAEDIWNWQYKGDD